MIYKIGDILLSTNSYLLWLPAYRQSPCIVIKIVNDRNGNKIKVHWFAHGTSSNSIYPGTEEEFVKIGSIDSSSKFLKLVL